MDLDLSDEELMCAYQGGDSRAFEILYQRISGKIYGYLRKRLQRREEIDECFQVVFTKLHKSRSHFDPAYSVEQWIYVIAKTTVLDHFRKQKRELCIEFGTSIENLEDPQANVPPSGEPMVPWDHLSSQQRKVVEWRVLDDLSYEEIAKRLDQSEMNVRQIFSRSVRKLRLVVQKEGKL